VSLRSRERVLLSLEPTAARAVLLSGAARAPAAQHELIGPAPACQAPWRGALELLADLLAGAPRLRGEATVVLSNAFVRYALVPHAGRVGAPEERAALARAQLEKLHGERVRDWEVRLGRGAAGAPGLAIGVDRALLEGLKAAFAPLAQRLRLVSVQPYLMSAFNRWRSLLPTEGGWLVLGEDQRVCVALLDGRDWRGVSVSREPEPSFERCLALVRRESARLAHAATRHLFVTLERPAGASGTHDPSWQVTPLPLEDLRYALAWTGR